MPTKTRRKNPPSRPAAEAKAPPRRDEGWDDRLRLVGDANFVKVEWSGKDSPCWPLPIK